MSDNEQKIETAADFKPSRNAIRNGIFGAAKTKSKVIDFFSQQVEVRQPSMRALLAIQAEEGTQAFRSATMIVNYTYVPGTDEKVFDSADVDSLQDMPFGEDMVRMNNAIGELTGVGAADVADAVKNSDDTQTD